MKRTLFLALCALAACKSGPDVAATPTTPKPAVTQAKPAVAEAVATPAAKAPAPVTTVEGVTEYQLDNGLRVLLVPDESQPKATVEIVYHVGSRHEGYGETGMAHLLEHMQFKGTPTHKDIWQELRDRGMNFNASTDYDRTEYHETFPASDDNLEYALGMEADRMVHSDIAPEALAKEFSVVRNEFETDENSPDNILEERVLSTAYLWHNYGKSVIGSRSDIERVPPKALKAFYLKYYQPDNAVLIVAGKIDKAKTLGLVTKYFGPIPRPARKLDATYTVEPAQDGERLVTLRRTGDVQIVGLAYHTVAGSDERFQAVQAIGFLLTDQPTGRLYKALVATGMASQVSAEEKPMAEPGWLYVEARVPPGKPVEPVREKMIQIVEGLAKQPPTDDEIARWKARQAKQFQLFLASSEGTAHGLVEAEAVGDWRLLYLRRDESQKLTAKAAAEVAATFLRPANRTVGVFYPTKNPERSPLPGVPDVVAMVKDYHGRPAVAEGEAFDATLDNIAKRMQVATLASGMKLALLPKKTRSQAVRAVMSFRYGTEKDLVGHEEAADLMAGMLMRGTKKHTYEQIKSELDRLKAQVTIGGTTGSVDVSITAERPTLGDVLALVTEMLTQPSFPKDQFEVLKKQQITQLQEQLSDPFAQAQTAAQRRMQPYPKTDIRYVPTTQEDIERHQAATLEDAKRLHRSFLGSSYAQASFVGDFDPAEVKAALDKGLGGWKSPRPFARVAIPYKPATVGEDKIDTPDKEGALVILGANLELRDDDPDYPALYMAGLVLGGGANSRLTIRLRQKEGWSYGAGGGVSADPIDKRGAFIVFALTAPQNAEKVLAGALDEIARLLKDGVPTDELEKAKGMYQAFFAQRLANDQAVAGLLNQNLYVGRTLDFQKQLNERIAALKPDAIAAVLKKPYFTAENLVKVVAADQKKAAAQAGK